MRRPMTTDAREDTKTKNTKHTTTKTTKEMKYTKKTTTGTQRHRERSANSCTRESRRRASHAAAKRRPRSTQPPKHTQQTDDVVWLLRRGWIRPDLRRYRPPATPVRRHALP